MIAINESPINRPHANSPPRQWSRNRQNEKEGLNPHIRHRNHILPILGPVPKHELARPLHDRRSRISQELGLRPQLATDLELIERRRVVECRDRRMVGDLLGYVVAVRAIGVVVATAEELAEDGVIAIVADW